MGRATTERLLSRSKLKIAKNNSLVRAQAEAEVFKMMKSGKRQKKAWKRMVTKGIVLIIFPFQLIFSSKKVCYVPDDFTRKMPKYERFIRPMAMRFKKAHVTHPELKATFCLPIIGTGFLYNNSSHIDGSYSFNNGN